MATQKNNRYFNDTQTKLLNTIIDKGNQEKHYNILVSEIEKLTDIKDKSLRSQLTTEKMRKYIYYHCKGKDSPASVSLMTKDKDNNEIDTFEKVKQLLNQDKQTSQQTQD